MDQLVRAIILSRVAPYALRKTTGGVVDDNIHQVAPGEFQPISELIACKTRCGYTAQLNRAAGQCSNTRLGENNGEA